MIRINARKFLLLHSQDAPHRRAAKNFFVRNWRLPKYIPFKEIGIIDDQIWRLPDALQTKYFPFMDHFFTHGNVSRGPEIHPPHSWGMWDAFSKEEKFSPKLEALYQISLAVNFPIDLIQQL